jgi:hypothetical protein
MIIKKELKPLNNYEQQDFYKCCYNVYNVIIEGEYVYSLELLAYHVCDDINDEPHIQTAHYYFKNYQDAHDAGVIWTLIMSYDYDFKVFPDLPKSYKRKVLIYY